MLWLMLFGLAVHAAPEVMQSWAEPVFLFIDEKNPDKFLVLAKSGKMARRTTIDIYGSWNDYKEVDKECLKPYLVYAHPILADATTTCLVDDRAQTVRFVGNTEPPEGHFDFIYFREKDGNHYFLFNGREFPKGKHGYLKVKVVSGDGIDQSIQNVLTKVPGFSGGMAYDRNEEVFYYSQASFNFTAVLHKINPNTLMNMIDDAEERDFKEVAKDPSKTINGLTFKLFISESVFLYDNSRHDQGVYLLKRSSLEKTVLQLCPDCQLRGNIGDKWYFLCDETELLGAATDELTSFIHR